MKELAGKKMRGLKIPLISAIDDLLPGTSSIIPLRGIRKARCFKSHFLDQGHVRLFYIIEELTEELRKTEKVAYEKLIRMLSHEVNNSLGAANSLLHSCLHYKSQLRMEDRADFETALTVAITRTEHLNSFMKSFADIVKLPLPKKQLIDIRLLLQNLLSLLDEELKGRRIDVVWDIDASPGPLSLDASQMEQVFLNILKNSMEAIDADGTITIRLGTAGRTGFVTIEDTGCGISEGAKRNLFTPFFSTKENGQGIGLTLVQEILAQHKFELSFESSPGQPTRFTIMF